MKFEEIYKINVNEYTEKKNGLTYLTWSYAWKEFKQIYPEATYEIKKFENNLPYVYDANTGYMVFTSVTADNLTYEMWLPVMDGANKAMKNVEYKYKAKSYGKEIEKTVQSATMFDINKTIMRCLVKNLAMFGLGLYIYSGEDLPEELKEEEKNIEEPKINSTMESSLRDKIKAREIPNETVIAILKKYGYAKLNEIKIVDLININRELGE